MAFRAVLVVLGVCLGSAHAADATRRLSAYDRATFCGRDGHEASAAYGEAVNRELTWRIAAGARTPKQALAQMREEYCLATGSTK